MSAGDWPPLTAPSMAATLETLHLWSQLLGKTRLAALPWLNQSWHVPLAISARGLTTGLVTAPDAAFELELDLVAERLRLTTVGGRSSEAPLGRSVADLSASVGSMLRDAGAALTIGPRPCEIEHPVAFDEDRAVRTFDPDAARSYWRALVSIERVLLRFRSRFVGKCSPVHLFWGSFDLAVTRFSGRPAPLPTHGGPGLPLAVDQDAYSEELASAGFWPGSPDRGPAFYVEAWPPPAGFAHAPLGGAGAAFDAGSGEWVLPYAALVAAGDPEERLLDFLQRAYDYVADEGGWDRTALERQEGPIGRPPEAIVDGPARRRTS